MYLFIEMFCDSENLPLLVNNQNLNLNQDLQEGMSKVTCPCELLWSHMQCRVGSSSKLSCLRSEDVLYVTSFITSELITPGVCCTHLFSPSQTAWRYMCKRSVIPLRTFIFTAYMDPPPPPTLSIDSACTPLMGLTGCFSCHMSVTYMPLSGCSQSETSWSESGSSINSTMSSLFRPLF